MFLTSPLIELAIALTTGTGWSGFWSGHGLTETIPDSDPPVTSGWPTVNPQNLAPDAKANTSDILVFRLFLTNIWNSVGFGTNYSRDAPFGGARSWVGLAQVGTRD
jgi:hypothetical protein